MSYFDNPITDRLRERGWTNERAAIKLYTRYKDDFDLRGLERFTKDRFIAVKLGNDEAQWLRDMFAEFFEVEEDKIPRKSKGKKKAVSN